MSRYVNDAAHLSRSQRHVAAGAGGARGDDRSDGRARQSVVAARRGAAGARARRAGARRGGAARRRAARGDRVHFGRHRGRTTSRSRLGRARGRLGGRASERRRAREPGARRRRTGRVDLDALAAAVAGGRRWSRCSWPTTRSACCRIYRRSSPSRGARARACTPTRCRRRASSPSTCARSASTRCRCRRTSSAGPRAWARCGCATGSTCEALLRGGHQERERRPGTENVVGIAGFGAACQAARSSGRRAALRDRFERGARRARRARGRRRCAARADDLVRRVRRRRRASSSCRRSTSRASRCRRARPAARARSSRRRCCARSASPRASASPSAPATAPTRSIACSRSCLRCSSESGGRDDGQRLDVRRLRQHVVGHDRSRHEALFAKSARSRASVSGAQLT